MTDDGTWDLRVRFPDGFTVRDLSRLHGILRERLDGIDDEYLMYWDEDGMDLYDVTSDEVRGILAAVESKEWDVAPNVSQLRSLICGEEGEGTIDPRPDLVSCPFCGAEPKVMVGPEIRIQCPVCGASSAMSATEENAIVKWNRRASL